MIHENKHYFMINKNILSILLGWGFFLIILSIIINIWRMPAEFRESIYPKIEILINDIPAKIKEISDNQIKNNGILLEDHLHIVNLEERIMPSCFKGYKTK